MKRQEPTTKGSGCCPHFERCICEKFDREFKGVGKAVLFGSHCRVCKSGAPLINVVPMDVDERVDEQCGRLMWANCCREGCKHGCWTYAAHHLEYSDERLLCDDAIWDRRDVPEQRTFIDHKLVFPKEAE
jgi:hypothetical protein